MLPGALLLLAGALALRGQSQTPVEPVASSAPTSASTQDRAAAESWWPTQRTAPRRAFVGQKACGACHGGESSTQGDTPMAQAAVRLPIGVQSSPIPSADFQNGDYTYRLLTEGAGLRVSVSSAGQSLSRQMSWIFGAGVHGKTYLYEAEGRWYESQVSSFAAPHGLDLTPGHRAAGSGALENALGERLSSGAAARCFACHTTLSSADSTFTAASAIPGIQCEACHGPGSAHVDAVTADASPKELAKTIFNPAHGKPADIVDFCGACHRTSQDVVEAREYGAINVRFQPYRLEKSRCWGASGDARLSCVACHDPHRPLVKSAAFYDDKCLACHRPHAAHSADPSSPAPAICPKATANCTGCHMPKTTVPDMHARFTDHFIRIVPANEAYPN